jgi:hypothetical protein
VLYFVVGAFAFVLFLFLANGFVWQAWDEDEFPDSELPEWFVRLFRDRPTEDTTS